MGDHCDPIAATGLPYASPIFEVFKMLRGMMLWVGVLAGMAGSLATGQGLSPEDSLARMQLPKGLRADLLASEPWVRQPVAIDWDDRGRLWVLQYLQYPNPEGLRRIEVDRYSRTRYDRLPAPPPDGPRGSDRLTILHDDDGDGRVDRGDDFLDGLNLASGFAFGHGGIFVLNIPYLLFYPDRDRNDLPDSDPKVLLTGFGMQDAHSVANSLTFGPDGWLYGCQGSTVTSNIRGIEFQQGVWRYHPSTDRFELFCEGGGNSWGLDFDAHGHLLYSTNYGGHLLLHGVQGGYYVKSFAKHGNLHNPYAFGYFEHAPHANFTGGHVTVGGMVYQGDLLPESFRGKYVAADLLGHAAYWHEIQPMGSTFATRHGGNLLQSNDPWFAPSDLTIGPDGAITIADWHDARTAHPDPDASWDRSNGRIFRITTWQSPPRAAPFDLSLLTDMQLMDEILHPVSANAWKKRRSRQELVRRYGSMAGEEIAPSELPNALIDRCRDAALQLDHPSAALEAIWTWISLEHARAQPIEEQDLARLLQSPHPSIRFWALRALGDQALWTDEWTISKSLAHLLDELSEVEPDLHVRQQLASTAARLPAGVAMPIINAQINRSIDVDDPMLPLLWWWAIERHAIDGREEVLRRFERPTLWKSKLGRDFLLPRLVRRYAAERSDQGDAALTRILKACPTPLDRLAVWEAIELGWQMNGSSADQPTGISPDASPVSWKPLLESDLQQHPMHSGLARLALRLGDREVQRRWTERIAIEDPDSEKLVEDFAVLAIRPAIDSPAMVLSILQRSKRLSVQLACVEYLSRIDTMEVADGMLELLKTPWEPRLRDRILAVLASRPTWAKKLLTTIGQGEISADEVPREVVQQLSSHNDSEIDSKVVKFWGRVVSATPEERLAEVRRLNNDLRAGPGDVGQGKLLFREHCAACHQLFGEGGQLGPDLTSANRKDRDFLLVSIVDPSSVIRKEYLSTIVRTEDDRVLTGIVKADGGSRVLLHPQRGEPIALALSEIAEAKESAMSLMPEDLYRQWSPQALRDLFAYLQSDPAISP
ncbi:MAG: PVC-type heme-binding CxxCH protein [Pirellulaceae bacterium]